MLPPLHAFICLLFFVSSSVSSHSSASSVHSSEDELSQMLSSLWHMDSEHRKLFHNEFRISSADDGDRLVAVLPSPSVLSRPIVTAFGQLCNALQSVNPNQSNNNSLRQKIDSFLAEMDKSPIFKKASEFYSAHRLSNSKSFNQKFRSLWFFPSSAIPFGSLMCRFSAFSGNWLSFISEQKRMNVKRLVVERESEDMALVEFGGSDAGGANAAATRSNAQPQRRHFALGDSVEFELSALSLCALLRRERHQQKKRCTFTMDEENGQTELSIEVQTSREAGDEHTRHILRAFAFVPLKRDGPSSAPISVDDFSSAIPEKRDGGRRSGRVGTVAAKRWQSMGTNKTMGRSKSMPSLRGPTNIQQLVDQMWEKDTERVDESVVRVDWQQHIPSRRVIDVSDSPFLAVSDESFLQRPIFAALVDIYNEQLFHPPVCQGEAPMNEQRRAKFDTLWALITRSEIYRMAYDYLDRLGKVDGLDFDAFTRQLFDRWFGAYTRCGTCKNGKCSRHGGPLGSSGWEHVFSGEWRGEIVDGHHSWVRFYLQEKAGDIEYHGYYVKPRHGQFIGTIQYKWKQYLKRIGGFMIGTSPAFDFSMLTVCILTEPGDRKCKFQLKETPMFVSSFLEDCVIDGSFRHNFCIATAYPGIGNSNES
ncbi:hypothetical protein niasHT_001088 [Heterodera trifolii]|uniref:EndoU domain-containing protein n=1 Tax=Heterodera trifolii TaxID=157864 RepID=A0ABD2LVQ1_9BILA